MALPSRETMIERVVDPAPRQLQGGPVFAGPQHLPRLEAERDARSAEIARLEAAERREEGDSSRARRVHNGQLARAREERLEIMRAIEAIGARQGEEERLLALQRNTDAEKAYAGDPLKDVGKGA